MNKLRLFAATVALSCSATGAQSTFAETLEPDPQTGVMLLAMSPSEEASYGRQLNEFLAAWQEKDLGKALALFGQLQTALKEKRDTGIAALAAWIYFESDQFDQAADWFEAALSWDTGLADARYGLALSYFRLDRLDESEAVLKESPAAPKHSQLLADIYFSRAVMANNEGRYRQSLAYLQEAAEWGKHDRGSALLSAWNHYNLGDDEKASALFVEAYEEKADQQAAQGIVLSYRRRGRWHELERLAEEKGEPLAQHWREALAQRYYQRKLFVASEHLTPGRLPPLMHIERPSLLAGVAFRDKSGTEGTSALRITAAPILEWATVFKGDHEWRLQLSRIDLDAGNLPDNTLIGSAPASGGFVTAPTTQLSGGIEPQLYYRHQGWLTTYGSIGLTPSDGELSSHLTGRLGFIQQLDSGNWQAELFSQPVRESILSYTGIVDPFSGRRWGRVARSGLAVSAITEVADQWYGTGRFQSAWLRGEEVASNRSLSMSVGLSRDLRLSGFDYFTLGPELTYESFDRNLVNYTFGHGGYFSPQRLLGVAVAANFLTEETRDFSIKGRATFGFFDRDEDAVACFPDGGVSGPTNAFCDNGFAAVSEGEINYSAEMIGVRRLADHWQAGGGLILRRTPNFDDSAAMLFVRYWFDGRKTTLSSDLPELLLQSLF